MNNQTKFFYNTELPQPSPQRLNELRKQVELLKSRPQPEQRTPEWFKFREGLITASDWGSVLGDNPYSNRNKVLTKKCEKNPTFFSNPACDWGKKYEEVAVLIYESRNNTKIIEYGCLQHPTIDFLGASPDGITPDGVMVEIKCPYRRKITGIPPKYYEDQVQGQLEVCELDRCDFLECKLEEFSEEEYFDYGYESSSESDVEKGIISVYLNKKSREFEHYYSPLNLNREQFEEWKEDQPCHFLNTDKYVFAEYTYWKLIQISNVPIYRDKVWFANSLIVLRKFWNDVLHYREVGLRQLRKDLVEEKRLKKKKDEEGEIFIDTSMLTYTSKTQSKTHVDSSDSADLSKDSSDSADLSKDSSKVTEPVTDSDVCLFSESCFKTAIKPVVKHIVKKRKSKSECLFNIESFVSSKSFDKGIEKKKHIKKTEQKIIKHIENLCLFDI